MQLCTHLDTKFRKYSEIYAPHFILTRGSNVPPQTSPPRLPALRASLLHSGPRSQASSKSLATPPWSILRQHCVGLQWGTFLEHWKNCG